ncbi:hypothetical protein CHARACLAT_030522 [Characodon lateralis]|uniref:Uncharacterized protein n=1 Tax=Characodon lateralis TaxID=208331 RepID=A0ABU7E4W4_9TELE|nr:hypothetical protein [Characodon lateralis]
MEERTTLMAGVVPLQAPTEAVESLLPAKGIQGPSLFPAPPPSSGTCSRCRPGRRRSVQALRRRLHCCTIHQLFHTGCCSPSPRHDPRHPCSEVHSLEKTKAPAAKEGVTFKVRAPSISTCSHSGLRKIKPTGHRLLTKASGERVNYCPMAAKGQNPEQWLASL